MPLQRLAGLVLLVVGVVLLIWGINALDSFASQFSKFFTGSPTDKAVWLTIAGAVMVVAGGSIAAMPGNLGRRS